MLAKQTHRQQAGSYKSFKCTKPSSLLQRGISLIELIMFIVIVSVALTGILLVMNTVIKSSADPLIHKQALAAAESLLEEIELQDFNMASGVAATSGTVNACQSRSGLSHRQ